MASDEERCLLMESPSPLDGQEDTGTSPVLQFTDVEELIIEEHLQDVFAAEGSSAILKFKIGLRTAESIVIWYKDGVIQQSTHELTITNEGDICKLQIPQVTMDDFGLYYAIGSDGGIPHRSQQKQHIQQRILTKAALYVNSSPLARQIELANLQIFSLSTLIRRNLINLSITSKETLILEIELNESNADQFFWYKSNVPILGNKRSYLNNDKNSSRLSIINAKVGDSGLYHVVAKTTSGIVSSFSTVISSKEMTIKERAPFIEEPLPDSIECTQFDNLRLICKVRFDAQTIIRWLKNGKETTDDEKFKKENHGNGYISLNIIQINTQDTAAYTLKVYNGEMKLADSTSSFVKVNACSFQIPEAIARLREPLKPVVACFGSHVILKCSFDLYDYKYFYVVWQIGRYRVERTNHLFTVVNYEGDFYLIIKCLEPDMMGGISCDLRRFYPNRKSVQIENTSASIMIVPPAFFDEEMRLHTSNERFIYLKHLDEIKKSNAEDTQQVQDYRPLTRLPTDPLEIIYCRMDDDRLSFIEVTKPSTDIDAKSLVFFNKEGLTMVGIKWAPLVTKSLFKWFRIEILQPNGSDLDCGLTSTPEFELQQPPTETILKFRITASYEGSGDSAVSILPPRSTEPISRETCKIKEMMEYIVRYDRTAEKIGSGAFGAVILVKNSSDDYFAAKILKTKTEKKRVRAMREYDIMSKLKHPRLVELIDVFVSENTCIFVMEYLWGGELFDRIVEEEHIKEQDVAFYIRQILEGLKYLHALKIGHLDIKPENIVCCNPNSRLVKVIDFGIARTLDDNQETRAIYGTMDYVAPEVLSYDKLTVACDMWSVGVVTYMLLSGVMPFAGKDWGQRANKITRGRYNFDDPAFADVSNLAKNFIRHLLVVDPYIRLDASLALTHQWITQGSPEGARTLKKLTKQNLKSYLATYRSRWQGGLMKTAEHWIHAKVWKARMRLLRSRTM